MKPAVGTTALPPADGIRPGDMFFVIGSFGNAWWGDAVDVPLQLSRASQKPVTVTYTTRNVTALGGVDYAPTSGTVAVNHGSSITIPILNDQYSEPVKAFEIVLTSVTGGKLDRAVGVVTILDDDAGSPPRPPPEHHRAARH